MKIILLGPPGSGKGTQAHLIKNFFNLKHMSTGELIRHEIEKSTEIGIFIKKEIKNGNLIKDDIISTLLEKHIKNNSNFLLDGFPRTLSQAIYLSKKNIDINFIIKLTLKTNIILKRLKYRIIHKTNSYNILYNIPKIKNKDNETGEKLTKRFDDSFKAIKNRLTDYNNNTEKIIHWYKNISNITEINSEMDTLTTFNNIKEHIKKNYHEKIF